MRSHQHTGLQLGDNRTKSDVRPLRHLPFQLHHTASSLHLDTQDELRLAHLGQTFGQVSLILRRAEAEHGQESPPRPQFLPRAKIHARHRHLCRQEEPDLVDFHHGLTDHHIDYDRGLRCLLTSL